MGQCYSTTNPCLLPYCEVITTSYKPLGGNLVHENPNLLNFVDIINVDIYLVMSDIPVVFICQFTYML